MLHAICYLLHSYLHVCCIAVAPFVFRPIQLKHKLHCNQTKVAIILTRYTHNYRGFMHHDCLATKQHSYTVKNGELRYTLGNKHPHPIRCFIYTHGCIYNTLSFIMGWSNTLKGVNTYRMHRHKGRTVGFILQ